MIITHMAPTHFGIAVGVLIPWDQTNRQHDLTLRIEDSDGAIILQSPGVPINVGRPATLEPGSDQHAVLAITLDVLFPHAGTYRVVARYDDRDERRWVFRIHDTPVATPES